jgi:hypothetical protein
MFGWACSCDGAYKFRYNFGRETPEKLLASVTELTEIGHEDKVGGTSSVMSNGEL